MRLIPKRVIKTCATKDFWLYDDRKPTETWKSQSFRFKYQRKVGYEIIYTSIDFRETEIVFNWFPPAFATKQEEKQFIKEVNQRLKPIKAAMVAYLAEHPEYRLRIVTGELRLINFQ